MLHLCNYMYNVRCVIFQVDNCNMALQIATELLSCPCEGSQFDYYEYKLKLIRKSIGVNRCHEHTNSCDVLTDLSAFFKRVFTCLKRQTSRSKHCDYLCAHDIYWHLLIYVFIAIYIHNNQTVNLRVGTKVVWSLSIMLSHCPSSHQP